MQWLAFTIGYEGLINVLFIAMLCGWFVAYFKSVDILVFVLSLLLIVFNIPFLGFVFQRAFLTAFLFDPAVILDFACLFVGVWGLFHSLRTLIVVLRGWRVIDSFNDLIEGGAGRSTWVMEQIEALVKKADLPYVTTSIQPASPNIFTKKETYLVITHHRLRRYRIYIRVRDFGIFLDVSWFLTAEPRYFKRFFSRTFRRNPRALAMQINFASQQDLKAFITAIHYCVIRVVKTLLEELDQDSSRLDTSHKGFLSAW
jgi:hypothetical protein